MYAVRTLSPLQALPHSIRPHLVAVPAIRWRPIPSAYTPSPLRHFHTSIRPMMADQQPLRDGTCEPCKGSTPALPQQEIDALLPSLESGWRLEPFVGSQQLSVLQRSFQFKNFRHALAFVNAVGAMAEQQKHHPEMVLGWGHVEVAWWTHAIGGLHRNDFVCAAKTDEIAQKAEGRKAV